MIAIRAHEQRRVDVYQKAYATYLKVFEKEITKKCSKPGLNKSQATNYKGKLETWLKSKQSSAKSEFLKWSKEQQEKITGEESTYLNVEGGKWQGSGKLFNSIGTPHQIKDPQPLDMNCPQ